MTCEYGRKPAGVVEKPSCQGRTKCARLREETERGRLLVQMTKYSQAGAVESR